MSSSLWLGSWLRLSLIVGSIALLIVEDIIGVVVTLRASLMSQIKHDWLNSGITMLSVSMITIGLVSVDIVLWVVWLVSGIVGMHLSGVLWISSIVVRVVLAVLRVISVVVSIVLHMLWRVDGMTVILTLGVVWHGKSVLVGILDWNLNISDNWLVHGVVGVWYLDVVVDGVVLSVGKRSDMSLG